MNSSKLSLLSDKDIVEECKKSEMFLNSISINQIIELAENERIDTAYFIVTLQLKEYSLYNHQYYNLLWTKLEVISRTNDESKIDSVIEEILTIPITEANYKLVDQLIAGNLFSIGRYEETMKLINKMEQFEPYGLDKTITYILLNQFKDAEREFANVDDTFHEFINCLYFYALGEYRKVIDLCEPHGENEYFFTFYQIASSIALKDYKYAKTIINIVLPSNSPKREKAAIYSAHIECLKKNYKKSLEILKKYHVIFPQLEIYPFFFAVRGKAKQELGDSVGALDDLNKAYRLFYRKKDINDVDQLIDDQLVFLRKVLGKDRQILIQKLSSLQSFESKVQVKISNDTSKINLFEKLKEEKVRLFSRILNTSNEKSSKNELSKEIDDLKIKYQKLASIIDESGLTNKVQIKKDFLDLQNEGFRYHKYAKAFYWTLLNYFQAYRVLSTDLAGKNINYDESASEHIIENGLKKAASNIINLAEGVPVVGSILKCMNSLIDGIYTKLKEKRFDDKMNAINKIIIFNNDPNSIFEEELSITIAKAAVEVTKMRKNTIDSPPAPEKRTIGEWFDRNIIMLKEDLFGKGVNIYDDQASTLALKDSALCLNYMYRNHEWIINSNTPLSDQIRNIVISGSHESILSESMRDGEIGSKDKAKLKCGCLII